jgi:valyl-tRNA synthetase
LKLADPDDAFTATASLITAAGVTVELDLSTAVDMKAERVRYTKELKVAEKESEQTSVKLNNDKFLANAKPAVIEQIRDRNSKARADIERITAILAAMPPDAAG